MLFSSKRPDWFWRPHGLEFNGYQRCLFCGRAAGAWSWPLISIVCRG